jgi:phage terminase small subunit
VPLTAKQESYCQAIVAGMNQSDAYKANYAAANMGADATYVEASRLMDNPKVAIRIQELRQPALDNLAWNLDRIVDEYAQNVQLGRVTNDRGAPVALSASNGAITGIGKALGILTDRVDVNVTHTLKPGLSLEELESRVARLVALEAGIVDGTASIVEPSVNSITSGD